MKTQWLNPKERNEGPWRGRPNKASVTAWRRTDRGNRVINVSDHRDHLLTRHGGRSKTFSLSFPSIFPRWLVSAVPQDRKRGLGGYTGDVSRFDDPQWGPTHIFVALGCEIIVPPGRCFCSYLRVDHGKHPNGNVENDGGTRLHLELRRYLHTELQLFACRYASTRGNVGIENCPYDTCTAR